MGGVAAERKAGGEKELLIRVIKKKESISPQHRVGGAPSVSGGQVLSWENYSGNCGPKAILKWLYAESRLSSSV